MPLVVLAAGAYWLLGEVRLRAAQAGYERIELGRSAFVEAPTWSDPRWQDILAQTLAQAGDVHPADRGALDAALASLQTLNFVRRVEPARVLWPAGLEFDVELRRPVACVRAGPRLYPVDGEGVVLSGAWSAPPWVDSGYLPLLVDEPDAMPFGPGDRLDGGHLFAALDVALSLWLELPAAQRERLGRVAIDARPPELRAAPSAHVDGVLLLLEGQRAVLFGEPPGIVAEVAPPPPGELSSARKWLHVSNALERLGSGAPDADWSHLDVRFDTAAIELRLAPGDVPTLIGGGFERRLGFAGTASPEGAGGGDPAAAGRKDGARVGGRGGSGVQ